MVNIIHLNFDSVTTCPSGFFRSTLTDSGSQKLIYLSSLLGLLKKPEEKSSGSLDPTLVREYGWGGILVLVTLRLHVGNTQRTCPFDWVDSIVG